jgi:hypothetical protein
MSLLERKRGCMREDRIRPSDVTIRVTTGAVDRESEPCMIGTSRRDVVVGMTAEAFVDDSDVFIIGNRAVAGEAVEGCVPPEQRKLRLLMVEPPGRRGSPPRLIMAAPTVEAEFAPMHRIVVTVGARHSDPVEHQVGVTRHAADDSVRSVQLKARAGMIEVVANRTPRDRCMAAGAFELEAFPVNRGVRRSRFAVLVLRAILRPHLTPHHGEHDAERQDPSLLTSAHGRAPPVCAKPRSDGESVNPLAA